MTTPHPPRGSKKAWAFQGIAGCVSLSRDRRTGWNVGVYAAAQAGFEDDPETPWVAVCEEHAARVGLRSLTAAKIAAEEPEAFCETCRDVALPDRAQTEEVLAWYAAEWDRRTRFVAGLEDSAPSGTDYKGAQGDPAIDWIDPRHRITWTEVLAALDRAGFDAGRIGAIDAREWWTRQRRRTEGRTDGRKRKTQPARD